MKRRAVLAVLAACAACGGHPTNDPALGSRMRVAGAQFVAGPMPVSTAGPGVAALDLPTSTVWAGEPAAAVGGALQPTATAAAVALSDDLGYWLVPAGVPDFSAPDLPTFHATASFSPDLPAGAYTLAVRAVDASGAFGPPSTQVLTALAASPGAPAPEGDLVVTLTWDTEADLDLHVVLPSGLEIDHAHRLVPSADGGVAAYLTQDSNAMCVIDGARRESFVWATDPAPGTYVVRVDTPSLCGQPIARWTVSAVLRGAPAGAATGVALDSDTWGPHDRGAGVTALTLDVP